MLIGGVVAAVGAIIIAYGNWRKDNEPKTEAPAALQQVTIDQHGQNNKQENSFNLHGPVTVATAPPPREMTEQNRQEIRAYIPKDAKVAITFALGDGEAQHYASQIYHFMKSDGYANLKPSDVKPGWAQVPKPPQSMAKVEDGSYLIFVGPNK